MNVVDIGANLALYQMAAQRSYSPPVNSTNSIPEDDGDGFQQSRESGKLQEIVSKYDLTNISGSELVKMGDELYSKNLITADEKQTFTRAADCPLKKIPVQKEQNGEYVKLSEEESSDSVKMDYINQWKACRASLEDDNSEGAKEISATADKVLNLFEKIGFYKENQES